MMKIQNFKLVSLVVVICSTDLSHVSCRENASASVTIVTCCDWNSDYKLDLLPHPTNCEAYYHCQPELFSNGRYGTIPTVKTCPPDEKGNPQHFDFLECRCLRKNEAVCYDESLSEHFLGFFNCTHPFIESGLSVKCTR